VLSRTHSTVKSGATVWLATAMPNGETPTKVRAARQADVLSQDDLLAIPGQL
jgi:hypothetical protein